MQRSCSASESNAVQCIGAGCASGSNPIQCTGADWHSQCKCSTCRPDWASGSNAAVHRVHPGTRAHNAPRQHTTARATFAAPARGHTHHMREPHPHHPSAPWLFAGVLAMSTTPIFRPARASTLSARSLQPAERPEPSQPHRLTRVCPLAPRLSELF